MSFREHSFGAHYRRAVQLRHATGQDNPTGLDAVQSIVVVTSLTGCLLQAIFTSAASPASVTPT